MTYELVYPDGQETQKVTLVEARKIASGFIGHNVEHGKKTYKVQAALFDPGQGVVLTTTTDETFVHVGLRKPRKAPSSSRVKDKPRIGVKLKCTCGNCPTCRNRKKFRRRRDKREPRKRGRPRKDVGKVRKIACLPVKNVNIGVKGMFKAGMTIEQIAGIFEVSSIFIEDLLREML